MSDVIEGCLFHCAVHSFAVFVSGVRACAWAFQSVPLTLVNIFNGERGLCSLSDVFMLAVVVATSVSPSLCWELLGMMFAESALTVVGVRALLAAVVVVCALIVVGVVVVCAFARLLEDNLGLAWVHCVVVVGCPWCWQ